MIKLKSTSKTNPNGNYDGVSMSFSASIGTERLSTDEMAAVVSHIEPIWNKAIAMINQAIDDCLQSDFITELPKVEVQ